MNRTEWQPSPCDPTGAPPKRRAGAGSADRLGPDVDSVSGAADSRAAQWRDERRPESPLDGLAPGEALLRVAFTASVRSTGAAQEAAPGRTSYALPADAVFRTLRDVATWLGATVYAVNEEAHWMVLLNPLHDPFRPQEHLTVSVIETSHETLVDVRPLGVEGRAFITCATTLVSETSQLLAAAGSSSDQRG